MLLDRVIAIVARPTACRLQKRCHFCGHKATPQIYHVACKLSNTKNQGNNNKERENNRQTEAQSTLQVAAAVCGASSICRFPLLIRLVPCYPDCRIRRAFVNYAQPLGVRQYETGRAGSSSNHATRLLQYVLSIRKGRETNNNKNTENQRKK